MKRSKYLYMKVTNDKYELPLIVEESSRELAERLGLKTATVRSYICRYERGEKIGTFRRVKINYEEE